MTWKSTPSVIVLLFYCCSFFAQSTNSVTRLDSLHKLLAAHPTLNEYKVDLLNELGFEYWIIDPNQSEVYAVQALEIAKILEYEKGKAFANRVIGVAHWVRGNPDLSFRYLLEAERSYRAINDSLGWANSMLNLGMAYADQQKLSSALAKYTEALQLFQALQESSRIATTYTKTAEVLIAKTEYEPAYDYLIQALTIHRENDFLYGIAEVNNKLGKLFMARENYSEAISYFLLSVEAGRKRNDHVGAAEAYHDIARCHLQLGELGQAERYLEQSEELANSFSLKKVQRDVYFTTKELAVQRGQYQRAVGYYEKYLAIRDSLFNEEKSNMIANMESQRTYEDKERELDMAQQKLDLMQAERQSSRLRWVAIALGLLVFALLGWGLMQRKHNMLAREQAALAEERSRTAALHDLVADKERELTSYTLNFVQKNELISGLRQAFNDLKKALRGQHREQLDTLTRQLNEALRVDEDWADFRKHFEHVHPQLIQRLNQSFPNLTKNEFRLIALLRLNLSSKEISTVLGISPDSVKTARYRLRKKLGLQNQEELFDFLLRFES